MTLIFHLSLTPSCLYFSSSSFLQPKPQIGLNKILKVLKLSFSVVTGQPSSLTTYQIVHLTVESAKSLGSDGHNKGLFAFPRQFSQSISLQSQQKTKHSPPRHALLETRLVIKNNRQRGPSKWDAEKRFIWCFSSPHLPPSLCCTAKRCRGQGEDEVSMTLVGGSPSSKNSVWVCLEGCFIK